MARAATSGRPYGLRCTPLTEFLIRPRSGHLNFSFLIFNSLFPPGADMKPLDKRMSRGVFSYLRREMFSISRASA